MNEEIPLAFRTLLAVYLPTARAVPSSVVVFETTTYVAVPAVAFAGTAENPAIANADAATSAMRLKLVFVDIIFLSRKVAIKNFFITAWPSNAVS